MIKQLEDELHEYDQVKSGELTLPRRAAGSNSTVHRKGPDCKGRRKPNWPAAGREQASDQPV